MTLKSGHSYIWNLKNNPTPVTFIAMHGPWAVVWNDFSGYIGVKPEGLTNG